MTSHGNNSLFFYCFFLGKILTLCLRGDPYTDPQKDYIIKPDFGDGFGQTFSIQS